MSPASKRAGVDDRIITLLSDFIYPTRALPIILVFIAAFTDEK